MPIYQNMIDFWSRVKVLLKENNLTQEKIALVVGIRADQFSRWIQRDILPNAEQSYKIANALGVSVEYLVTGNEPDNSSAVNDVKQKLTELTDSINKL